MKTAPAIVQILPSARKIWLNIHLWLRLTAGLVLALIGLTGSLLALYGPLMQMELGYRVEGSPPAHADIDGWIAAAHRTYPEIGANRFRYRSGFCAGGKQGSECGRCGPDGRYLTIIVNPSSGLPLNKFYWDDTYTAEGFLKFHTRLSSSMALAREAIAWLAVVMLVSLVTGLYLWWPRNRNWRVAFTLKRGARGRRRLLDLHNLFAVYLYVPLFVIAFTGVYFAKPHWIEPCGPVFVRAADRRRRLRWLGRRNPERATARTTPGQAVDLAKARTSDRQICPDDDPENKPNSRFRYSSLLRTISTSRARPRCMSIANVRSS